MKRRQAVNDGQLAYSNKQTRCVLRTSFLFVICIFLFSCSQPPEVLSLSGQTMGTRYHITLVNYDNQKALASKRAVLQQQINDKLAYINQLMSTYISDSEISRFNASPHDVWFNLSPEMATVVAYSLYLSDVTNGKFDVTVSPLIDLWGFGASGDMDFPSEDAIALAKSQVGWQSVILDKDNLRIKKTKPLSIDLSSIAKGYGVDVIAQLLEEKNVQNYLVEIGGEIRVKGKNPDGINWRVGVETPSFAQISAKKIIQLSDQSVATSGDYRNFFEKDGVRYSHTIDPSTGKPVIHSIASLTVIVGNNKTEGEKGVASNSSMKSDGLATAFMALGEQKAIELANQLGVAIYILSYDEDVFTESFSSAFTPYLTEAQ
jgi:FAD:protein FMN transferase